MYKTTKECDDRIAVINHQLNILFSDETNIKESIKTLEMEKSILTNNKELILRDMPVVRA